MIHIENRTLDRFAIDLLGGGGVITRASLDSIEPRVSPCALQNEHLPKTAATRLQRFIDAIAAV